MAEEGGLRRVSSIDPDRPIPVYFQLKTLLLEQILQGEYAPGDRLPTEQALCAVHGLSRTSVGRALSELADEGVIVRYRRRGSFVNPHWSPPDPEAPGTGETAFSDAELDYLTGERRLARVATKAGVEGRRFRIRAPLLRLGNGPVALVGNLPYQIASQIFQPKRKNRFVVGTTSQLPPGAQDAQRFEQQILGQVEDRGADLLVHRMAPGVGRPAQRDDQDIEAATLKRGDLLGDERLGEARVTFEYESDPQPRDLPFLIRCARPGAALGAATARSKAQPAAKRS